MKTYKVVFKSDKDVNIGNKEGVERYVTVKAESTTNAYSKIACLDIMKLNRITDIQII